MGIAERPLKFEFKIRSLLLTSMLNFDLSAKFLSRSIMYNYLLHNLESSLAKFTVKQANLKEAICIP
jgi:hypothetical protein